MRGGGGRGWGEGEGWGGEGGKVRRAGTCLHPSISPDWFPIYLVGIPPIKTIFLFQCLCGYFVFILHLPFFSRLGAL